MNPQEAQDRMREVQRIMERTTLYTLLPGTPAIVGGVLALIGCAVSFALLRSVNFADVPTLPMSQQVALGVMWALIGIAGVAHEVLWSLRSAKLQELSATSRPARLAAYSLTPSVLVAAVLTWKLAADGQMGYIVPVWMMCYGTGVYSAGLFSVKLPRLLGLAFIILGAAGLLFFAEYGLVLAGVSFGLLHIIFGAAIKLRTGESDAS